MNDTLNNPSLNPSPAPSSEIGAPKIDPKLLEILVCPLTKGTLVYDEKAQELISTQAGLAYPIRQGIPIMLPDEARALASTSYE